MSNVNVFRIGMAIILENVSIESHRDRYCNRIGHIAKIIKTKDMVDIVFPNGDTYRAYTKNVIPA